jgi:acetyl-CoA acetyltransferase
MRPVALVGFSHSELRPESPLDEVELTQQVCSSLRDKLGLKQQDIDLVVSGSCDFLSGRPFVFISALDGLGAVPPIDESHVEMDGAFALYEAWVRLQSGEIDCALVYAFGRSSQANLNRLLGLQSDPHWGAPLGLDEQAIAGLQASAAGLLGAGLERLPEADGAAAVLLAAGDRARQLCPRPAWIRAIDHRIDRSELGQRNLGQLPALERSAEAVSLSSHQVEYAELHAVFTHQQQMLKTTLGLGDELPTNQGKTSAFDAFMVSGLMHLGEAAEAVMQGRVKRSLGHASAGPALQQNLLCVFGDSP